jgi:hypothetical protein
MFDTTYVDQLGKTISGEFYFGNNVSRDQATDCDLD